MIERQKWYATRYEKGNVSPSGRSGGVRVTEIILRTFVNYADILSGKYTAIIWLFSNEQFIFGGFYFSELLFRVEWNGSHKHTASLGKKKQFVRGVVIKSKLYIYGKCTTTTISQYVCMYGDQIAPVA